MHVHTFRAESLQAALQLVRHTLGPDASILQTREKRQSRLGIFGKTLIEVDAVLDVADATAPSGPADSAQAVNLTHVTSESSKVIQPDPLVHNDIVLPAETHSAAMLEVQADLLASGVSSRLVSTLLREVSDRSDSRESPHGNAEELDDSWALRGRVGQRIAARLKVSGSIELVGNKPHVVAFVGPTGVGKTTTLAKIASGFRFDLGCRIGLVALDTFRLGAVDQLLQYAELISAPLEVVSAPEQITGALERLGDCDLVLLDTAGRAPRDTEQLAELRRFLQLAQPHSTQLVVSATSSVAHVAQTVERFSVLQPTNLLITKLDEAVEFGSWLDLLDHTSLPISYLTHGQQVPQDIMVASARRLASLLLGHLQPYAGSPPQPQAI